MGSFLLLLSGCAVLCCARSSLCPGLRHTGGTTLCSMGTECFWALSTREHCRPLQTLHGSLEEHRHSYTEKNLCKSLFSALVPPFFSITYLAVGIQMHSNVCALLLCWSGFALCSAAMSCEHCILHSGAGAALPSSCSRTVDPDCGHLHTTLQTKVQSHCLHVNSLWFWFLSFKINRAFYFCVQKHCSAHA